MEVNERVKITNTDSIWDDKEGTIESIDGDTVTVYVEFNKEENKFVRQIFNINNLKRLSLYKCSTICLIDINDLNKYIDDIYNYLTILQQINIDSLTSNLAEQENFSNIIENQISELQMEKQDIENFVSRVKDDLYNYLIMINMYRKFIYTKIQEYNYKYSDFINDPDVKYIINFVFNN